MNLVKSVWSILLLSLLLAGCTGEAPKHAIGETCVSSLDCATANCEGGTCAKAKLDGPCSNSMECSLPLTCSSGKCVNKNEWCGLKEEINSLGWSPLIFLGVIALLIFGMVTSIASHKITIGNVTVSFGAAVVCCIAAYLAVQAITPC